MACDCNTHHHRRAQSRGQRWGYFLALRLHPERVTRAFGCHSPTLLASGLH